MKKFAEFLVGIVGLVLALSTSGALAATECNTGPPGPPPFAPFSGAVGGGVVVNAGDFCFLDGAHISGGVRVNGGGILISCGSSITGGIIANGALNLLIGAGADEVGPPVNFDCPGNVISGGVQISNTGPGVIPGPPSISLERNAISGAVHLIGNDGPIVVSSDTISGGLFCANNTFDLDDEGMPSVVTGAIHCEFE